MGYIVRFLHWACTTLLACRFVCFARFGCVCYMVRYACQVWLFWRWHLEFIYIICMYIYNRTVFKNLSTFESFLKSLSTFEPSPNFSAHSSLPHKYICIHTYIHVWQLHATYGEAMLLGSALYVAIPRLVLSQGFPCWNVYMCDTCLGHRVSCI